MNTINKNKYPEFVIGICTERSESLCALIEGVGNDVHERLYWINWIKQLHTLPVLHFNRCSTSEYSETTTHFNGNFDTNNQIYVT
jgi:hypothetical protein